MITPFTTPENMKLIKDTVCEILSLKLGRPVAIDYSKQDEQDEDGNVIGPKEPVELEHVALDGGDGKYDFLYEGAPLGLTVQMNGDVIHHLTFSNG